MADAQDNVSLQIALIRRDLDILWMLLGTTYVFFMQTGFALLEAGSVRSKNTKNILVKNVLDACVGALIWWGVGYSFAFGEGGPMPNAFIGGKNFFLSDVDGDDPQFYGLWLFQWAFAATAATIVSGAVAERCQFSAYMCYTAVLTGIVYPVVVHWVWSSEGWLSAFRSPVYFDKSVGLIDYAGSGVVHLLGGSAALVGASVLGPRRGRYDTAGNLVDLPGHSVVLSALGTFILWFGWYGFNSGSTLCVVDCMPVASQIAVATTLSAAASGITVFMINATRGKPADVVPALNGILAGLVSITAGCSVVEAHAAVVIGVVGGSVYCLTSAVLKKLRIDDPLDASPVHMFCGIWGLLSVGIYARPENLLAAYGRKTDVGIFYGGNGTQLGIQVLGAISITLWSMGFSGILFLVLKKLSLLRVSEADETSGLDISKHGGSAYYFDLPTDVAPRIKVEPPKEALVHPI